MKVVARTKTFAVIDDLLTPDLHLGVWLDLQSEDYSSKNLLDHYNKLWRLGNTLPVSTTAYLSSTGFPKDRPYIPLLASAFCQVADNFPELVGKSGDLRIHAQLFSRGVKIGWHLDSHSAGSFTYYAHPKWSANWGGELFVPDGLPPQADPLPTTYDFLIEEEMLANGVGFYITPKPNRLILLAPGVMHCVNRVDDDAGDHLRATVVGFMLK